MTFAGPALLGSVQDLQQRSNVFDPALIEACKPQLEEWNANVRPGTILNAGAAICQIGRVARGPDRPTRRAAPSSASRPICKAFRAQHKLDQVVVINVASTEAAVARWASSTRACKSSSRTLDGKQPMSRPAALYAWAALDLGLPYINFTPSLGASFPAALELAQERKTVTGGKDGKTGETLLKIGAGADVRPAQLAAS